MGKPERALPRGTWRLTGASFSDQGLCIFPGCGSAGEAGIGGPSSRVNARVEVRCGVISLHEEWGWERPAGLPWPWL